MIDYDPHSWRSHLFDIRGSMAKEILVRVAIFTVWTVGVVAVHYWTPFDLSFPPTVHQLVGVALGLLLVFRTNSSYDRFWEGRKLWGGIVNESRNLARQASVHLIADENLRNKLVLGTIAFAYASMHSLRRKTLAADSRELLGRLGGHLSREEFERLAAAEHLPIAIAAWLTSQLRTARDQGHLSDIVLTTLDQNVQLLVDYLGGCERIHKTPIPYAYMVHVRRALILYCGSLPFSLVKDFGWETVPVVVLLTYVFLGIEEIGVEIEDPFGEDDNDLPLERICGTIERNLLEIIGLPREQENSLAE